MAANRTETNEEDPGLFDCFEYEGVKFPGTNLKSSLDDVKTFEVRPDDIFLCTFPKSGTHFTLELLSLILADGDPSRVDRTTHLAAITGITEYRPPTVKTQQQLDNEPQTTPPLPSRFIDVIKEARSPRIIICHLPFQLLPPDLLNKARVVYVARNAKDVVTSMMRFTEKTVPYPGGFHQLLLDMMSGDIVFGPWYNHVMGYWTKRDDENLMFLTYEEIKKNLPEVAQRLSTFLHRPLSPEVLDKVVEGSMFDGMKKAYDKIEKTSSNGVYLTRYGGKMSFLQKGVVGSWKERFTVAENEVFDQWYKDKFAGSDLQFEFE